MNSVCGVFPVPPTVRLPILMTGKSYSCDVKIPVLKQKFLKETPNPYNKEKGSKRIFNIASTFIWFKGAKLLN